jgi:Mn2+/Fe2+ NRAMP family transporter
MGEFVAPRALQALGWAIAVAVIVLNVTLLVLTFTGST